jgi:hypothetical protein
MSQILVTIPVSVRVRKKPVTWTLGDWYGRSTVNGFHDQELKTTNDFLDGWAIRDRFLSLYRTESDLLKFLHWVGAFLPVPLQAEYEISAIWKCQDFFRNVLLDKDVNWRAAWGGQFRSFARFATLEEGCPSMQFVLGSRKPMAVLEPLCGLYAIKATLDLDLLRGAEFRWCVRPDCPTKIFRVTSRHKRKYCSYRCAHLQSIRNSRGTVVMVERDY